MQVTSLTYEGGQYEVRGYISSRLMAAYDFPDGHTLHLSPIGSDDDGRVPWHYVLERNGVVIFEGEDFRTSAYSEVDPAEAARDLLGFLTLREGDTDAEYFDNYTDEQLAWRDMYAEELSLYAMEDES